MTTDLIVVETAPCRWCGVGAALPVRWDAFVEWQKGASVMAAFPELDAGQRELLISGTHEHCWEAMWAGLDDGELRSCDECGEVEDAGAFPDQDGEGRCAACAERTG